MSVFLPVQAGSRTIVAKSGREGFCRASYRVMQWIVSLVSISAGFCGAAAALEARVEASLDSRAGGWVGQRHTLRVDLRTDGSSFRNLRIRLPEIFGALLIEDASTTVKWSETIDGEPWQVIRYEYPLFPQRAGALRIRSISVEGEVMAGFGSGAAGFRAQTKSIGFSAKWPPGMEAFVELITTPDLSVRVDVDRDLERVRVGEAFTRTITREARDASGIALAPLTYDPIEGVAIYPKSPEISDRSDRGELIGRRVEAATYVLQKPGPVRLPEIEIAYWDPLTERVRVVQVPSLELEVSAEPVIERFSRAARDRLVWIERHPLQAALLSGLAILVVAIAHRGLRVARSRFSLARRAWSESEAGRFRELRRACRRGCPDEVYAAYRRWLPLLPEPENAASLEAHSALIREGELLQTALVRGASGWQGGPLLQSVRRARRRRVSSQPRSPLAPLNPGHRLRPLDSEAGRLGSRPGSRL